MSDASLRPYVPRLVADWNGPPAQELEGTLVSVDVSGFTTLSERLQARGRAGAEELVLLMSGIYTELVAISESRGGDVLKLRGDSVLLFFSAGDHHRSAYDAASAMQLLIDDTSWTMCSVGPLTLQMSTGMYTGPCQFFLVDGTHSELIVTGPAATETIRLASEAVPGAILVSGKRPKAEPVPLELATIEPAQDLERFVPAPLRAHLLLDARGAEHRHVTAAFLKFAGVDKLFERERMDSVHARVAALARLVGDTCAELGLTWLESRIDADGGKLFLVSGAPSSTAKDEEQMLLALRTILDGHAEACEPGTISLRAGVSRGAAFCGDVGADVRHAYGVMGDMVDLAARLADRAADGQILATGNVLDRAHKRYVAPVQAFLVKRKDRPVTAYSVGAVIGERKEDPTAELPLVGVDAELEVLAEAVEAARRREQRLVELVGEAGIGKSRLVEELKRQASGFTQLVAHCDPYAAATPYFAMRGLLRPLAGIKLELDEAAAGAQLTPLIQAVLPDLACWLPLLAIPFGAEVSPTPESDAIAGSFRRQRLHDAIEEFLAQMLVMPTLLVLEDMHWADDASLDLVRHLTRQPAARPWLLCVTRRAYGGAVARDVTGHSPLALLPLDADVAQSLVLAAAGDFALSTEAVNTVCERSGGNPLFVRELVAAVRSTGRTDALPESIQNLIASRIDMLAPEDRLLLRNASALGTRFELDVLAEVLADDLEQVADLARWERLAEFVAWDGVRELRFRHDLIREVSYEGMSVGRRRDLHERVGGALERRGSDPALLSMHFFEAQRYEQAWKYARMAGERAHAQHANVVAAELYERALAAADHLELPAEDVADVHEALGDVAGLFADYDKATDAYEHARDLVGDLGQLLLKEGRICERRGLYEEALDWFDRASAHAGDEDTGLEAEIARASVLFRQARYHDSIELAQRAAERAEFAGNQSALAHACLTLDAAYTHLGRFDPTWCERARAIYEELDDVTGLAVVLNNLGIHAYYSGRYGDALDFYVRSRQAKERIGDVEGTAMAMNNEAEILSDQGHYERAEHLFRSVLRISGAAGYPMMETIATTNLGRLAARCGRFSEAHSLLDEAGEKLRAIGSEGHALEADMRRVECLVLEGRPGEALELAEPALARAGQLGRIATLGPSLERSLGYALHQSARADEARPHFEESLRLAREARAEYEVALTLHALAETTGSASGESEALFKRLGVVTTPAVPLP